MIETLTHPYVLLLVGLLLVFLEFYLPGAILGTIGAIFLIFSLVLFAFGATTPWITFLYFIVVIVLVGFTIRFALWNIRRTTHQNTLFLSDDQTGYKASSYNHSIVGKEGVALTDLKPSGFIEIEDQDYQAMAETGYLIKGTPVTVIGGQGAYLIVRKQNGL